MDQAMEAARKALDRGRGVDAVALALAAVARHVRPQPGRMRMLTRAGYNSVFGGREAVASWMATLPQRNDCVPLGPGALDL